MNIFRLHRTNLRSLELTVTDSSTTLKTSSLCLTEGKIPFCFYRILAEGPGVARGKFFLKKRIFEKKNLEKKNFEKIIFGFFFSHYHPQATHECSHKISAQSVQPFGRL